MGPKSTGVSYEMSSTPAATAMDRNRDGTVETRFGEDAGERWVEVLVEGAWQRTKNVTQGPTAVVLVDGKERNVVRKEDLTFEYANGDDDTSESAGAAEE